MKNKYPRIIVARASEYAIIPTCWALTKVIPLRKKNAGITLAISVCKQIIIRSISDGILKNKNGLNIMTNGIVW